MGISKTPSEIIKMPIINLASPFNAKRCLR